MRGIRGAVCLTADDAVQMREAVGELLTTMLERNHLTTMQVVSVILTSTPDLTCAFPAAGAREVGFGDIPLLCAQEINVAGALERVIRVLMHVESDAPRASIQHVYLRGAEVLRLDLHS
jgi:chorismate mutase